MPGDGLRLWLMPGGGQLMHWGRRLRLHVTVPAVVCVALSLQLLRQAWVPGALPGARSARQRCTIRPARQQRRQHRIV